MFRKTSLIFLLIFSLLLTGTACDKKKGTDQTEGLESVYLEENVNDAAFTLVVVDYAEVPKSEVLTKAQYTTDLLNEKGMNITVEIYRPDYTMDVRPQYMTYLHDKIKRGENIIFPAVFLSDEDITSMKSDGVITDLSNSLLKEAPNFYRDTFLDKNFKYNTSGPISDLYYPNDKIYALPLGKNEEFRQTMVLVRKEIAEAYGKDIVINDLDDYIKLLKWIHENYNQYKLTLFPLRMTVSDPKDNFFTILSDFLDCSLLQDTIISSMSEVPFYSDIDPDLSALRKSSRIDMQPISLHPDFKDAMTKIIKLRDDGFLNFTNAYINLDVNDYATIISNTSEYSIQNYEALTENDLKISNAGSYNAYMVGLSGRTIHTGSANSYGGYFCLSGDDIGVASMLYFIEWLYSRQANYDLFIYGKEGVDYKVTDDRITLIKNNNMIYGNMMPYSVFYNTDLDRKLGSYPANWDAIKKQFKEIDQTPDLFTYLRINKLYTQIPEYEWIDFDKGIVAWEAEKQFLYDPFVYLKSNTEQIIDTFIAFCADSQTIKDLGTGYREYTENLLSYLPE